MAIKRQPESFAVDQWILTSPVVMQLLRRCMAAIIVGVLVQALWAGTALAENTLSVMEHSGDFAEWVQTKTIDEPEDSLFSFQNKLGNIVDASWQLSSQHWPGTTSFWRACCWW